jgi:aminoglycoside phosphotransferase family enzyme/predicted kinase
VTQPDVDVATQRAVFERWLAVRDPAVPATFVETHISILGIQGGRVFKLKKAVAFPFVDLSTVELRHADCEREVALNRRFAPDVYLGVVPITDDETTVDVAVEMRRMPADRRLSTIARAGGDAVGCIEIVADLVARQHASAVRGPQVDADATAVALRLRWERELHEAEAFNDDILDRDIAHEIVRLVARYLDGRAPLFAERIERGRVCDGHGDLLADDVYCLADGPRVLDCLEFDDHLRHGDVVSDVAFLAMDLEHIGRHDLAYAFLERYSESSRSAWPSSLAHLYIAQRALVRAKVACLRARQGIDPTARTEAATLQHLSLRHLREGRIRLVLVGGAPGTGKTTLAASIADATGWTVLRSDVVRKQLAGITPEHSARTSIDRGLYAAEWTGRTYRALLASATDLCAHGESVIIDASFGDPSWREAAAQVARDTSADLEMICCVVPLAIAEGRVAGRRHDASDADPEIARGLAQRFAPWPGAVEIDTSNNAQQSCKQAFAALDVRI